MIQLLSLIFTLVHATSLVQETKDIECKNSEASVFIDKRDRYIEIKNISTDQIQKYDLVEFLDSAILLKKNNSEDYALIQMTPKNRSVLIEGSMKPFTESDCKDMGASKTCAVNEKELFWSSTRLSFDEVASGNSFLNLNVQHYGVYPNDGTYFLAFSSRGAALAVIDFGSKLNLLYGASKHLSCKYL